MMTPLEERLTKEVESLRQENKLLREKIDLLVRRIFGKSSEGLDERQLMLMLQGEDSAKKEQASSASPGALEAEIEAGNKQLKAKAQRPERKARLPDNLPVSEEIIVDPEEVQAEPQAWRQMGEEVTEQLDYSPAKFSKRRIIRRKYVKRDEPFSAPIIAPLDTLAQRSLAAPGLLAQIIVGKYCDHLPLYRQEQIYRLRHGVELPRQSLARWLGLAADWLHPVYESIRTGVLGGGYIQCDETVIEYLCPGHGQTKQGYLWTIKRPGGDAAYHWHTSRSADILERIIPVEFSGVIGCDGYQAYRTHAARSEGRITLAACWAHARRKFDEAKETAPRQASLVLLLMQRLYQIEKQLRESGVSAKLRQVKRAAHSRMIVQRIGRLLERWQRHRSFLPQSLMGRAISYTLNLWPQLQHFLEDGRAEIDSNLVENAIRPTAVGKKNYLFFGDAQAGERSAILYTIIEACRARRIDPWEYLREVLTRLPSMTIQQVASITPEAWAAMHQSTAKPTRPQQAAA